VSLRHTELIAAARAEREGLGRTIQFAPPHSWEEASACPGWWNRDVMAHLAAQDYAAAQLLGGDRPEELDDYREGLGDESFDVDGFNELVVNRRAGLPYRDVLNHWGRAADLLLEEAADLPIEDWNGRRANWLAGEIGIPYLLQSRIIEWWIHGEDIRAGARMSARIEHLPIHATNDLAIRMLPWSLGQAGIRADGLSVQVDLEGAGGGSWHWGLGAGEAPGPGKKPDAFIEGRALPFALIAGRRVPAEASLEDGNLVIGGEEALAEVLLEHLRAYP
jgi:uncharacterized protein (TIGR03083 family)